MERSASRRLVNFHYWSFDPEHPCSCCEQRRGGDASLGHAFGRNVAFTEEKLRANPSPRYTDGWPERKEDVLYDLLREAGLQDGEEYVLVVIPTERRPFGDRRIRSHTESDQYCGNRKIWVALDPEPQTP